MVHPGDLVQFFTRRGVANARVVTVASNPSGSEPLLALQLVGKFGNGRPVAGFVAHLNDAGPAPKRYWIQCQKRS